MSILYRAGRGLQIVNQLIICFDDVMLVKGVGHSQDLTVVGGRLACPTVLRSGEGPNMGLGW